MTIKDLGFTESWWQSFLRYKIFRTKRIKLAVVGSNSHGKSYLLFDLIRAFALLGYKIGELPLFSPYANWNGYFKDILTEDGCVKGTDRYACRQENHYGAVLSKGGDSKIDIEFLNIPGEVFNPNLGSISAFYDIKSAIEKTGRGIFEVTTWKSVAGDVKYVVEPSESVRKSNNLPVPDYDPKDVEIKSASFRSDYQDWPHLFAYLRKLQLEPDPSSRKSISGQELLRNFFKYQPDSLMRSIYDAWDSLRTKSYNVTADDFINQKYNNDFYFHMYCLQATDIVVCDKLFAPKGSQPSEAESNGAKGFVDLVQQLKQFIDSNLNKSKSPNVYLAFRGADMLINEANAQKVYEELCGLKHPNPSNAIYSIFLHQLLKSIKTKTNDYTYPEDIKLKDWLGIYKPEGLDLAQINIFEPGDVKTLTESDLKGHISSRMGNKASAFKQLLYTVTENKMLSGLLESNTLPIAPHVFFTSTPIDDEYHIYIPDADNKNQRFIRRDPETGIVTALNVEGHYLSFGTTQLCMDILSQYEVKDLYNKGGGLLLRMFTKFQ